MSSTSARHRRVAALIALSFLGAAAVTGCSTTGHPSAAVGPERAALTAPTPLETSVQTSSGVWATIPMGDLSQPANTFWQLFFRPTRSTRWSDRVEATATATNGGLVLASAGGRSLIVGVRPSMDLTFTPLITTSGSARSWSDGLILESLATRPDALAAGPGGEALALVSDGRSTKVLASSGGHLSRWRPVTSAAALAASALGRSCGLGRVTAVGYLGNHPTVGGSCGRPGVVGIFSQRDGSWHLSGPSLAASLRRGRAEVLALTGTSTATSVLLEIANGAHDSLVAAWRGPADKWVTSVPYPMAPDQAVASFGQAGGSGLFVLLRDGAGAESLVEAGTASPSAETGGWQRLAPPPPGTATVAFDGAGPVDALVAKGSLLTVWSLTSSATAWARHQVVHVPVQYGSSS